MVIYMKDTINSKYHHPPGSHIYIDTYLPIKNLYPRDLKCASKEYIYIQFDIDSKSTEKKTMTKITN